jgi:hypothetical protein
MVGRWLLTFGVPKVFLSFGVRVLAALAVVSWSHGLCAVGPDPLARAWQQSLERGAAMGDGGLFLLLRLAVFLEVASIACGLSLRRTNKLPDGNREALQWVIAAASFMLALLLPLSALPIYGESRGFVALCSLLAVAVLPYILSGLLVRRAGRRKLLAGSLYLGIVILFVSQLLD